MSSPYIARLANLRADSPFYDYVLDAALSDYEHSHSARDRAVELLSVADPGEFVMPYNCVVARTRSRVNPPKAALAQFGSTTLCARAVRQPGRLGRITTSPNRIIRRRLRQRAEHTDGGTDSDRN